METIFMNTEKSKRNKPHQFVMNFLQINMSAFKTCLFTTCGKMYKNSQLVIISPTWNDESELPCGKMYKNSQLIIISPTWNDESELPDGSYLVSNI